MENLQTLTEDECDYCEKTVYICGGDDIFLEGWGKSLACIECSEKYNLVDEWLEWLNELEER
ncbi:hypothetical protein [Oceanobacillus timonensis]|uniref:hypothetical protein n=1 Tax=Oceanobacillus timonensis TaxID=1926285 RepID=UPI0009B98E15|nr:hypothetical protein [Oceanobacillus timonensis]